jgi:two-component system, NarL family, invasion response regulator UvrY
MPGILLVDDHPIVLQGCRTVLEEAGVSDVHEARDLAAAYRLYHRKRPSLIILDLSLRGRGLAGLSLISRIRMRDTRTPILVFSMHSDPIIVRRALDTGANGYLLKDTAADELLDALAALRRGAPFLSQKLALPVALLGAGGANDRITRRELQTLSLLADGKAYGQIAEELGLSYKTVANTCSQLKSKLGAGTLQELVRGAIEYMGAKAS